MRPPLGSIGSPPDPVAASALVFGTVLLGLALFKPKLLEQALSRLGAGRALGLLALAAALLSAGYVAYYLRGGPRIIDATSYWLEARALAAGDWSLPLPFPSGSFRGRFLLPGADGTSQFVLFPPGYPLLLAFGFWIGVPLAVGPLLAALLVLSTYALTKQLLGKVEIALLAALLSTLSAALRYHTADTMSHGLAALLLVLVLLGASSGSGRSALLSGLAAGWLLATRPVTGLAALIVALLMLARKGKAALGLLALGIVPGLVLFELYQQAATGSPWQTAQAAYYSLADGPPGCFRYGFGQGVGCKVEHGDFVRAHLSDGYGFGAALGTSARRLYWHLSDAANLELIALLVPLAVALGFRRPAIRWLGLSVLLVVIGYAPFYFDASYPGGGARLFADVLPCEHALIAWALVELKLARWAAPASLLGYALHTSFDHRLLSEREGGRPMFEAEVLERAGVRRGLVFVATDHGFNLGHEPGELRAHERVVVARRRGDAHDHLLWSRLGNPPAFEYVFDFSRSGATPRLVPYRPSATLRFEAEAEWPPLAMSSGWAHVAYPAQPCVSGRRVLMLRPERGSATAVLELGVASAGEYQLLLGLPPTPKAGGELSLALGGLRHVERVQANTDCTLRQAGIVRLSPGPHRIRLSASADSVAVDFAELRKIASD
jgi:hypothetical protein